MLFRSDDTGLEQAEYISLPIPMVLVNGQSPIGTGKSCYVTERDAREICEWIRDMEHNNDWDIRNHPAPKPMSVTGCKTWYEPSNGYIYYEAVVHEKVNMNDLNKRGKYDVITALPPKKTPDIVMNNLINKLPTRVSKQIVDGSGKGRPIWIVVPHGYLDKSDYMKYGMRTARKESIYIWDENGANGAGTMRSGDLVEIAKRWFDDRCGVVTNPTAAVNRFRAAASKPNA